jgi:hypothetical protein
MGGARKKRMWWGIVGMGGVRKKRARTLTPARRMKV